MNVNDLLTLAKAGYTPELLTKLLGVEEKPQPKIELPAEETKEESKQEEKKEEPKEEPKQEEKKEEPDYKALYEEEQKKVKKLQAQNVSKDISGGSAPISVEDHVLEIFKDFFK